MDEPMLNAIPPGRWGIGVSGGADSVALLVLAKQCPGIDLHVIHLDHQTRDGESTTDAEFVGELCTRLRLSATIQERSVIEQSIEPKLNNISARYRRARYALFAKTVAEHNLTGVLLAHHADDQAETVLMRILRGSALQNLGGMRSDTTIQGVRIVRPLLDISGSELKQFLTRMGQPWREDSSNRLDAYQRNRLRRWLADHPEISTHLIGLARESSRLHRRLVESAPKLEACFASRLLSDLPAPLARTSAAAWLADCGVPRGLIDVAVCDRLVRMASDSATSWRQSFPGNVMVRRRKGRILMETGHPFTA